jgi:hypothetical protein
MKTNTIEIKLDIDASILLSMREKKMNLKRTSSFIVPLVYIRQAN